MKEVEEPRKRVFLFQPPALIFYRASQHGVTLWGNNKFTELKMLAAQGFRRFVLFPSRAPFQRLIKSNIVQITRLSAGFLTSFCPCLSNLVR